MTVAAITQECVAVLDANCAETGAVLTAPAPAPRELLVGGVRYELREFRECRQFGCGCVWEERVGYVVADPNGITNEGNGTR